MRYSLGFIDQGILSLASILYLVLAAQFLSPEDLGTFVLGLSTAVLLQSLVRALCGETLLVRSTSVDYTDGERERSLGLSLLVALVIAFGLVLLAWIFTQDSVFYLSLAVSQLGILLQDAVRFGALAAGKSGGLLALDGAYTVLCCFGIYAAGAMDLGSSGMLVFLGCTALLVGITGAVIYRTRPRFISGIRWLARHWRLNSSFVTEAALGALLGYAITLILNFFASGPELAAYRSALSIFGLTSLAINFLRTMVLRDLRAVHLRQRRSYWRKVTAMSLLIAVTVGITYLALAYLPEGIGLLLFGETWVVMAGLFAATALNRFFAGLSVVPTIFLRVQGITWRATFVRITITILGFALGPVGAFLAGARGALLAEAFTYLTLAVSLMVLSRKCSRRALHRLEPVRTRRRRRALTIEASKVSR